MRRLLWRLFPPYEVGVIRRDINTLLSADHGVCVGQVRNEALRLTKDMDRIVYSIRIDRVKPDQLALILIHNVLTRNLENGWNHVYRGTLSMIGHDMLRLWEVTAKEMVKRGYQTEEEYLADTSELQRAIREVG
ncbi:MAG TPA: hypothetical protein VN678_07945 [Acidobacteriaceae bacterium]|nr:hypothetical protein [Acidobacteriaceae bacterium]